MVPHAWALTHAHGRTIYLFIHKLVVVAHPTLVDTVTRCQPRGDCGGGWCPLLCDVGGKVGGPPATPPHWFAAPPPPPRSARVCASHPARHRRLSLAPVWAPRGCALVQGTRRASYHVRGCGDHARPRVGAAPRRVCAPCLEEGRRECAGTCASRRIGSGSRDLQWARACVVLLATKLAKRYVVVAQLLRLRGPLLAAAA